MPGEHTPLPSDAPAGTPVLVVEDDQTLTRTSMRSAPWKLGSGHMVVQLKGRSGSFLARRCYLDEDTHG